MNNSKLAIEHVSLQEEEVVDTSPELRRQSEELADVIEALEKVSQSSYWKVLHNKIFDKDLLTLKSRLSKEKDTVEIFRLQGQITRAEQYDLDKMLIDSRNKLINLRKQIHD